MSRFGNAFKFMVLVFVIVPGLPACVLAGWPLDGNPISTASGSQEFPRIATDGAGGGIISWQDTRSGGTDIYAQRLDAQGLVRWTLDGVAVCVAADYQEYAQIVSDGAGGAIITWQDRRSGSGYDIYAQRLDAAGAVRWTFDGVPVCTVADYQEYPQIASDGAGGAIITWQDRRSATDYDIYAQRIDALGALKWGVGGVAICTASSDQQYPQIGSDGGGGAIIVWEDYRNGDFTDIYAQRVDAQGAVKWGTNGVAVCTAAEYQEAPRIVSDESSGAIITWNDYRSGAGYDIYAQRVDGLGIVQWSLDGVPICTSASDQQYPQIVGDGVGGAIITWQDNRGIDNDIYAQRVDAFGAVKWGTNGVAICTAPGYQQYPQIVSDGASGGIISWADYRGGDNDIYARRVDALGVVKWATNGVAICTAVGDQQYPQMVSNGIGGAIVTWEDYRGLNSDIYAQRVKSDGTTNLLFGSVSATAERDHVDISWHVSIEVPESSFIVSRSQERDAAFTTLDAQVRKEAGFAFSCTDYSVLPEHTYWYKIVLRGPGGDDTYGPFEVRLSAAPGAYQAYQSYPNPFNPRCTIRYDIPIPGRVSLNIFNANGSLVRALVNGWREQGVYSEVWDGRAHDGAELPSGVYFYRLEAGTFVAVRKMVLLR